MTSSTDSDAPCARPLEGVTIAGKYVLGKTLGEGGMGAVYAAKNQDGADVAVKILHADVARDDPEAVARFFQESTTSSKLSSPHITRTLDAGRDPRADANFLVMELLSGFDLRALIDRTGTVDPRVAVRIAAQAAGGLAAAHASGIVHRDVKPENLFLAIDSDEVVTVKICDFGIAKLMGDDATGLTKTGTLIGSPVYMSPEQSKSAKHVDARTDVWSLGITLYEMLSGKLPYDADTLTDLVLAVAAGDVRELQDRAPWILPEYALVVHSALKKDLDARFPSMEAFAAALAAVMDDHTDSSTGGAHVTRSALVGASPAARAVVARRAIVPAIAPSSERPPPSAKDPYANATLGGRYRILRQLGRGGMGAVYEAEDHDGARFAIKVIRNEKGPSSVEARRRFVREARAVSVLASENIVSVLEVDAAIETGEPFIVMELLSGSDLDALVERVGPVEPRAAVRLFIQACSGLREAHRQGIVHRDIKPANLFLHEAESGEIVLKICDFGIAKNTEVNTADSSSKALTRTGGMIGSPVYMSPEQAKNAKHVDARSDVWSLCLTMYESLSGTRPWPECTTVGELIVAICTEDIPALQSIAPWIDPALAAVVHRGLARSLADRWASVDELAEALEPFSGGALHVERSALEVMRNVRRPAPQVDSNATTLSASSVQPRSGTAATVPEMHPNGARAWPARPVAAAVGVAALLVAGGLALSQMERSPNVPSSSSPIAAERAVTSAAATTTTGSAASPPGQGSARIAVRPPEATVTVNGVARRVVDGHVELRGEPGETFTVVVTHGAQEC